VWVFMNDVWLNDEMRVLCMRVCSAVMGHAEVKLPRQFRRAPE